jgi:hypothetical protein
LKITGGYETNEPLRDPKVMADSSPAQTFPDYPSDHGTELKEGAAAMPTSANESRRHRRVFLNRSPLFRREAIRDRPPRGRGLSQWRRLHLQGRGALKGEPLMKRIVWYCASLAIVMAAAVGVAKDVKQDIITERILFRSGTTDFDEIFPVTERLNQILSEISRIEVEAQRGVPSFLVYPYDPTGNNGQPYALLWSDGAYVMSERLPTGNSTFLIYDPRRLSLADSSVEDGQQVEYRHIVLNYGLNSPPQAGKPILDASSRLEPTDRSLYISREIIGSRSSAADRIICFPRLEIPKDIQGEAVQMVSVQIESALHPSGPVGREMPRESLLARGIDLFLFRVK